MCGSNACSRNSMQQLYAPLTTTLTFRRCCGVFRPEHQLQPKHAANVWRLYGAIYFGVDLRKRPAL